MNTYTIRGTVFGFIEGDFLPDNEYAARKFTDYLDENDEGDSFSPELEELCSLAYEYIRNAKEVRAKRGLKEDFSSYLQCESICMRRFVAELPLRVGVIYNTLKKEGKIP